MTSFVDASPLAKFCLQQVQSDRLELISNFLANEVMKVDNILIHLQSIRDVSYPDNAEQKLNVHKNTIQVDKRSEL
jgi:hypothetical protein